MLNNLHKMIKMTTKRNSKCLHRNAQNICIIFFKIFAYKGTTCLHEMHIRFAQNAQNILKYATNFGMDEKDLNVCILICSSNRKSWSPVVLCAELQNVADFNILANLLKIFRGLQSLLILQRLCGILMHFFLSQKFF